MTALSPHSDTILIADSGAGVTWSVNTEFGACMKAYNDPLMAPLSPGPGIGVNGIKTQEGKIFFTNSDQTLFASEPVEGPSATKIIALPSAGDFQLDRCVKLYFAGSNELRTLS